MRRVSLTQQLFLIYTIVLLLTTLTFYSILSGWLFDIYTDINYNKLDDFALTTKTILENDYDIDFLNKDNDIEYFIWGDGGIAHSKNFFKMMSQEYLDSKFSGIESTLVTEDVYRGILDDGLYFYSAIRTDDSSHYIFTVTSGIIIEEMRNSTGTQIMVLFIIILIGGGIVLAAWSNTVVRRIGKISNHVKVMPKLSYSKSYDDIYPDEIGSLSNCIEDMRIQIYENEETKKEIMQNLSHDLKTPLAVIKSYSEAIVDEVEGIEAGLLIIKQADILQHKVEKLLQLNRLNYLEIDKPFEAIKIINVINKVVDNVKYLTNIKFELSLDDSIFMGYEENYITLVENIISNAMRYAQTKIVIKLEDNKLSIYNDGEHIEEKFMNAEFKAYEKGSKGMFGVGMSIVKRTSDFFGLDLSVTNEEVGVTFVIEVPKRNK